MVSRVSRSGIVWKQMSLASTVRRQRLGQRRGDLLLAAVIAMAVTATLVYRAVHYHQPLALLLIPPALAPVFMRRSRPFAALLLAVIVTSVIPTDGALALPVLAVLYTIASRDTWPTPVAAGVAVTLTAVISEIGWVIPAVWATSSATWLPRVHRARPRLRSGSTSVRGAE